MQTKIFSFPYSGKKTSKVITTLPKYYKQKRNIRNKYFNFISFVLYNFKFVQIHLKNNIFNENIEMIVTQNAGQARDMKQLKIILQIYFDKFYV